jgi:hypothetical protein
MPQVFDISAQQTKNVGGMPLMDPNARNAEFQAAARLGQAMQAPAGLMENISQQIQEHENKGRMAELQGKRLDLDAQIASMIESNQSRPEVWAEEREALIKSYNAQREKDLEGAPPLVREADELAHKEWLNNNTANFTLTLNKGKISRSNAQIEAFAQQRLRNGDHDGYLETMQQLNATPEQLERMIRKGLDDGLYNVGDLAIQRMTKIEELEAYIEEITAKDEEGNYLAMERPEGGISYGARTQLVRYANSKILQIKQQQYRNEDRMIPDLRAGKVGIRDIDRSIEAGEITEEFGNFQKHLVELKAEAQAVEKDIDGNKTTYKLIQDMMAPHWVQAILGNVPELSDREYTDILKTIENSALLLDTKIDLGEQWLDLKAADLEDFEEESDTWRDRNLGPVELQVRKNLIEDYRNLLPDLGVLNAGLMMMDHERRLRTFFTSNPEATAEEAETWLMQRVRNPMLMKAMATRAEAAVDFGE